MIPWQIKKKPFLIRKCMQTQLEIVAKSDIDECFGMISERRLLVDNILRNVFLFYL